MSHLPHLSHLSHSFYYIGDVLRFFPLIIKHILLFYFKQQLNAMKLQGSIVKKTREEKGYKQCYLAYLIGISQSHLSKIESDKAVVTVPELVKIAGSLEKPIAFFVS